MADSDVELNTLLREGHAGVRKALAQIQAQGKSLDWMTSYLLHAIRTDAVPAITYEKYLNACRSNLQAVLTGLKETQDNQVRTPSIRHFIKLIRSATTFATAWNRVGGARGLATLMSQFSVDHVKILCKGLATTSNIPGARIERQQAISELFELLYAIYEPDTTSYSEHRTGHDPRSLRPVYFQLVKACYAEACSRWDQDPAMRAVNKHSFKQLLYQHQPDAYCVEIIQEQFAPLAPGAPASDFSSVLDAVRCYSGSGKSFTLQVFKRVVEAGPSRFTVKPQDIKRLAIPLFEHLRKHSDKHATKMEVWELVFGSYEKWPSLLQKTYMSDWEAYLHHAVCWWKWAKSETSRVDSLRVLKRLLELIPADEAYGLTLGNIATFLNRAKLPPARRYELFCIILRHYSRFNIDIDQPTEADKVKLISIKDCNRDVLFTICPPPKALQILEIYLNPRSPDFWVSALGHGRSILGHSGVEPGSHVILVDILHCYLRHQVQGKSQDVKDLIQNPMTRAKESRDWEGRAFWAKSALFLSIASGDLDLYSRTLLWAKRFHRDHKTVAALYNADALGTREGLRLLGGVPVKERLHLRSLDQVQADIVQGNKIITQLLGLVREGLNEAGISNSTWSYVTSGSLVADIFKVRARYADDFKQYHSLSDDEVFPLVWQPTIDLLVEVEAFAIEETHLGYNFCKPAGIVGLDNIGRRVTTTAHLWRFFDELAKARDDLWKKIRCQRYPKTLDLEPIWPRGLPAHLLCRLDPGRKFNSSTLPYIMSRVRGVIFVNPGDAFSSQPEEGDLQRAVGGFVESYSQCLKFYLDADNEDDTTRSGRSEKAWSHATTTLSKGRLSDEEVTIFWRQWVQGWAHLDNMAKVTAAQHSGLDKTETHGGKSEPRYLPPKALDIILRNNRQDLVINKLFQNGKYPLFTHVDPTSVKEKSNASGEQQFDYDGNREALIAASLRALDSTSEGFLKTTMVSLGKDKPQIQMSSQRALGLLEYFRDTVPVGNLRDLAFKAEQTGEQDGRLVLGLTRLVAASSRPWEACPLIRNLIAAGQKYSASHRKFLGLGFLNRLPPAIAKSFIQDLGRDISERLEAPRTEEEPDPTVHSQPAVKITTVKMLAEVLRTTRAIDVHTGIDILMRIFLVAKHIDIRAAVVQSLLDAFEKTDNDQLRESIMHALRDSAVGVASAIDERSPMSDQEWVQVETDRKIPDVPHNNRNVTDARPISRLLVGHISQLKKSRFDWAARWYENIVLAILLRSIDNNKRWMKLFLTLKNAETATVEMLPPVPVEPTLLDEILENCIEFLTRDTYDILKRVALFHASIPEPIRNITREVREKEVLESKTASNHWCLCNSRPPTPSFNDPISSVRKVGALLEDPPQWLSERTHNNLGVADDGVSKEVTIADLQGFLFEVIETVVMEYPDTQQALERLMKMVVFRYLLNVHGDCPRTARSYKAWTDNMLVVARRFVQLVENIRTSDKQLTSSGSGVTRRPRCLPGTFPYRVWMLPVPSTIFNDGDEKPAKPEEISSFCKGVYVLVDELAERAVYEGVPYHANWRMLKEFVCKDPAAYNREWMGRGVISSGEFYRIAVGLWELDVDVDEVRGGHGSGGVVGHFKLRTGLVFELVNELIRKAHDELDDRVGDRADVVRKVKEMLGGWMDSEEEWTRSVALGTVGSLKSAADSPGFVAREFKELWEGSLIAVRARYPQRWIDDGYRLLSLKWELS